MRAERAPRPARPSTVFRACPPLGDLRTIMGKRGREASLLLRAFPWISRMSAIAPIQRGGHELMHRFRLVAFDEVGGPTATLEELLQLLVPMRPAPSDC